MSCGIYKITNTVNNKVYIGQSVDIERRWIQEKCRNINTYLKHAFDFYGIDKFTFEIIEILPRDKKILDEREIFYINQFNSFNNQYGYNLTKGGGGSIGFHLSEETKQKLSEMKKGDKSVWYGKHHTEETKEKQRQKALARGGAFEKGEKNHFYNKHHSEETKKIMKEKASKRDKSTYKGVKGGANWNAKKCLCVETGVIYDSVSTASKEIGAIDTNVARACRCGTKCRGYHWKYI